MIHYAREVQDRIKKALGKQAAYLVENGMVVGLGSGTTAAYFIENLVHRKDTEGLEIKAVSSSKKSAEKASAGGIVVLDINSIDQIDLTIDGADEVDDMNRLIKGGGGAHVREKIVASCSKEMVVIVDESKLVSVLGAFGLPVEILPFGYPSTIKKLNIMGFYGILRKKTSQELYATDNGNFLYDLHTPNKFLEPEKAHQKIIDVPGVVDTGFFFNLASRILVGYQDGRIAFKT